MSHFDIMKDIVVDALAQRKINYSVRDDLEDRFVVTFNINLQKTRLKSCQLLVIVTADDIQTFGVSPIRADETVFATVAEYITRANYNLKLGNFQMDYRDGEVRYHTCLCCTDGEPCQADVDRHMLMPAFMYDRYGDGLVKALMGYGEPKLDIAMAEDK